MRKELSIKVENNLIALIIKHQTVDIVYKATALSTAKGFLCRINLGL